jgi:long-chain acyl-CoA synthetase
MLDAVYLGATLAILEPELPDGVGGEVPFVNRCGRVAEMLRMENVRFYPGVPYQFAVLAALPMNFPIDLGALRLCVSSGDTLPRHTYDRFLLRFNHPIRSLFGSTEAGSISIDTDAAEAIEFGSLGLPLKNVAIAIRGEDGDEKPPGADGEIWVRSPALPATGYDNRLELNAKVFRDGYYNTGDVGHNDVRGRLWITGRRQTFVDIAGYKVDLGEVEEVLQKCPGVREAAALGVEIPNMGTLIKAVVVPENCREADIRSFCRERLAFVKVPRIIETRVELPRSPIGKVLKSQLADVTAYLERIRAGQSGVWSKQLPGASPERQRRLLRLLVQAQVAAVLGRAPDEIPGNLGFTELGMDSFASIELRARLEYLLGRPFSETFTFDHPTVAAIVDHLASQSAAACIEPETAGRT